MLIPLGIVGHFAQSRYQNLGDAADNVMVDSIFSNVERYLSKINSYRHTLASTLDNTANIDIGGIKIHYRNG